MLVRQRVDAFIRQFGHLGYITSQLTKKDRVYDGAGRVFLCALSRKPKHSGAIINELLNKFTGATPDQLRDDFYEFINELETEGYLVTGKRSEDLNKKDVHFTYRANNPKTAAFHLLTHDRDLTVTPTDDFMTHYFRDHPTIFGAHFEVTQRCNEQCIHCYQTRHKARHADISMVEDFFGQLHEMGTVSMTFSGGEPTMHENFPKILELARKHDLMINILSNGLMMKPDVLDAIRDVNINMIQISLYSMEPHIHETITRVHGSHAKTLNTIERLIEHDVPVQISCPIMKQNRHSYRGVSRWCNARKIRVLSDFVMMAKSDFDTSNLEHRLDIDQTRNVIQDIIDTDGEYQLLLEEAPKTRDIDAYSKQPVCGVAIDNACFTADGAMYPCSGFQGYKLGNVHEKSIREIWESSERVIFLRSIRNASFPKCLACEARDFCIMCLVRNYNESNGDMFKIADHFCEVAFLNKELVDKYQSNKATSR